ADSGVDAPLADRRRKARRPRPGPRGPPGSGCPEAMGLRRDVIDAVIVGSGPNGLVAAVELARAGASVRVLEARDEIGGGVRTAALTLPGFAHDVCSGCHPMGALSPFFSTLPLEEHGRRWIYPAAAVAPPLEAG